MVKGKLEDELEAISKVSSEQQREALLELTNSAISWLDDEVDPTCEIGRFLYFLPMKTQNHSDFFF